MIRKTGLVSALALAFLTPAGPAMAQENPPVTLIVLHPARVPVPALKYRLLPDRRNQVAGNAAVFYHRAIEQMLEIRDSEIARKKGPDNRTDEQAMGDWINGPIAAIPMDRAREWLDRNHRVLSEAELGSRRSSCDWEFDSRPEGFDLVINEIQWMRSVARLVALRARVSIRENQLEDAFHWLQVGHAMGRHVSQGPILIQTLVGVATCSVMTLATEDLIQAPGMPSIFWALADRPHPFIDPSEALEGERFFLEREIPELRELDGLPWSVEKARAFADRLADKLYALGEWPSPGRLGWGAPETNEWLSKLGVAALVAQAYPQAKRSLSARGLTPARVDAMPAIQVVFLDVYNGYQAYRDDIFKWRSFPLTQTSEGMSRSEKALAETNGKPLLRLFCNLMVTIQPARMSVDRLERRLDALQCIESIRMYLAAHGRLPARLEDLVDAPAPLDPMTGRPFEYRVEGGRAFLSAPNVPPTSLHSSFGLHYELKPAG
jgi:hypothetical protein